MEQTKQKGNVLAIAMMFFLFAMIAFVTNLASPMGVIVKEQFQASNFEGMLGNFANFLAYLFMGIPSGMLLQRIGYKKTALLAVVVGFVGVGVMFLSGVAASFAVYLLGAFIAGFSMCMLNAVVNPMLNTLGGGGNKGNQLIQIGGSLNSLAATLTPVLVGAMIGVVTKSTAITDVNPVLFTAMGVFALVFIVLAIVKIAEPAITAEKSDKKDKYSAWSFRHFVLGAIAIGVYVGVEVGVPATLLLFLTDPTAGVAMNAGAAGSIIGMYWLLMLFGRLTGGAIGGKVSSKAMITCASSLGILLLIVALVSSTTSTISLPVLSDWKFVMMDAPLPALFIILVGLCTSIMWGGIFNLAVEGLGKYTKMAAGIFMMMVCGGGIISAFQGFIADKGGFMLSYIVPIIGLAYILYYALVGSKNVNKNIPVE